jgi:hypothetical protein
VDDDVETRNKLRCCADDFVNTKSSPSNEHVWVRVVIQLPQIICAYFAWHDIILQYQKDSFKSDPKFYKYDDWLLKCVCCSGERNWWRLLGSDDVLA